MTEQLSLIEGGGLPPIAGRPGAATQAARGFVSERLRRPLEVPRLDAFSPSKAPTLGELASEEG
jgi:hypothetical protein